MCGSLLAHRPQRKKAEGCGQTLCAYVWFLLVNDGLHGFGSLEDLKTTSAQYPEAETGRQNMHEICVCVAGLHYQSYSFKYWHTTNCLLIKQ